MGFYKHADKPVPQYQGLFFLLEIILKCLYNLKVAL